MAHPNMINVILNHNENDCQYSDYGFPDWNFGQSPHCPFRPK
jgi:hypothetical protein